MSVSNQLLYYNYNMKYIIMTIESKEELQKILNEFWLLDGKDYDTIRSFIEFEYNDIMEILSKDPNNEEEKQSLSEVGALLAKVDYIISKGLYKK